MDLLSCYLLSHPFPITSKLFLYQFLFESILVSTWYNPFILSHTTYKPWFNSFGYYRQTLIVMAKSYKMSILTPRPENKTPKSTQLLLNTYISHTTKNILHDILNLHTNVNWISWCKSNIQPTLWRCFEETFCCIIALKQRWLYGD